MMTIEDLLAKYLQNQTTADENAVLMDWVLLSEENKQHFSAVCGYWYAAGRKNNEKEFNSTRAYTKFLSTVSEEQSTSRSIFSPFARKLSAAAAVVILFVSTFLVLNQKNTELLLVQNTQNSIQEVVLPDGSLVFLNTHASISYPEVFSETSRQVSLEGHAFFSVIHNPEAPFFVLGSDITTQVLGTEFDITINPDFSSVIVASGSVQVSVNATNDSKILTENERVDFTSGIGLTKSVNTDKNYLSWQTGILIFEQTPLSKVFTDMERQYNCSFTISNETILSQELTGTFENLDLTEMLDVISLTFSSLSYSITEGVILIDSK